MEERQLSLNPFSRIFLSQMPTATDLEGGNYFNNETLKYVKNHQSETGGM